MSMTKFCPNCESPHNEKGSCCCMECSVAMITKTIKQMQKKEGPIYERWKRGMKKAVEAL